MSSYHDIRFPTDVALESMHRPRRYTRTAQALHWLIFLLVVLQMLFVLIRPVIQRGITNPQLSVTVHMSIGLLILALVLFRIIWRFFNAPPPPPRGTPWWESLLAILVHYALYASLIAMSIVGWLWASGLGWHISFLGLVTVPPLAAKSAALVLFAGFAHKFLAVIITGLIGLHVLAALYHWLVRDDGIAERMVPRSVLRLLRPILDPIFGSFLRMFS